MNTLYSLDNVAIALENSANISRIKKLLYFVAYGKWESDRQKLAKIELKTIISEISNLDYSLEDLDNLLKDICGKINKQIEYLAIANQITQALSPLYQESLEKLSSGPSTALPNKATQGDLSASDPHDSSLTKLSCDELIDRNNELFEIRLKLVQRTNPLRVKILIFSALENKMFDFTEQQWSALKKHRLDRLLKNLLKRCPNQKSLENLLYKTAKNFENKNETIQVASAIVKYLSSLYKDNSDSSSQSSVSEGKSVENLDYLDARTVPINCNSQSILDRIHQKNSEYLKQKNGSGSSLAKEIESLQHYQYPGQVYAPHDDVTIPELHTNVPEPAKNLNNHREMSGDRPMKSEKSQPASSGGKLKITESLKRRLSLEEEINNLVNYHVNRLVQEVEDGLGELEYFLDERLKEEEAKKAFLLKYNSLKSMIAQMQDNTSKYLELLNEMHEAEIQQLKVSENPNSTRRSNSETAQETSEPDNADAPGDKVMELAKQGNAKAIAATIERAIEGRGIHTLATIKNDCLHVVLESEQQPNQKASINLVRKHVLPLQLTSITKVKVHWLKTGKKTPDWSYEFAYTLDS